VAHNFYFGKQADVVAGAANFAALIATGFASYGISSSQSTAFGALNTTLQADYSTAVDPSTRTRGAVATKNASILAMRAMAINLAKIIYATPTVTDAQLIDLGLLPRSSRSPVPPPADAPVLEVGVVSGRLVNVRVHAGGSERRGKPVGAVGANVYSYVGQAPPADPRDYHFEGMTTRTITQLLFPDTVAGGATVWLSACWVSARGATSPACAPVPFAIQGGGTLPAAA
jgi:hypothetical protein